MQYPINYIAIVQPYKKGSHNGIDFGWYSVLHRGMPVYAVDDGTVIYSQYQTSGGYVLHIKHANGFVSEYGHLKVNSIKVNVGDKVSRGQQIANMGESGNVTGMHLHFGLYKGTKINYSEKTNFVDPMKYLELYSNQTLNDKTKKLYGSQIIVHKDEIIKYVYNVDDEGLVVRKQPNGIKTGEYLQAGTKVTVYDTSGLYSKIGDNKWVASAYLSNKQPKTKTVYNVKKPPLNVRNKPSVEGKIVGNLKNGDVVQVYKTKNGWSKVSKTEERWTVSAYLK